MRSAPAATTEPVSERSRRRFARRQWARRWLAWKYVVAVLLLLALLIGTVWAVFFSSVLAVTRVQVTGVQTLASQDVARAAAVPLGEPLARVDLDQIRSRVAALAAVEDATVTRQWPHSIVVRITERVAVAVVEVGGRIRGMDAEGVLFRDYQRAPAGVPQVRTSVDTRSEALQEAAHVVSSLPADLVLLVDHVQVESVDRISLVLRDGREVVWGSAEQSEQKAQVIAVLLEQSAQTYDVSVPGQPTTAG